MRNTGWKIISLIMIICLSGIPVFAKGLGGWINMVRSTSDSYEEGEKISATESVNRNVYLKFN